MFDVSFLLILIIIVALIFDFTNGAHDCANAIATVVSTKVLSPRTAVIMAATLNLIGAFLGTKVAQHARIGHCPPRYCRKLPAAGACGPDRGDRLEPVHMAFRDPLLFLPCADRRAHGGRRGLCRLFIPQRGLHPDQNTAAAGPLPSGWIR